MYLLHESCFATNNLLTDKTRVHYSMFIFLVTSWISDTVYQPLLTKQHHLLCLYGCTLSWFSSYLSVPSVSPTISSHTFCFFFFCLSSDPFCSLSSPLHQLITSLGFQYNFSISTDDTQIYNSTSQLTPSVSSCITNLLTYGYTYIWIHTIY